MFFGQKIHPLNFDYADTLTVAGDTVAVSYTHLDVYKRQIQSNPRNAGTEKHKVGKWVMADISRW